MSAAGTPSENGAGASDLLRWAETLAGIARTGLGFTQSLYEQERFEEVLRVAADIRVAETGFRFGLPETGLGMVPGWSGTQS